MDTMHGYEQKPFVHGRQEGARQSVSTIRVRLRKFLDTARTPGWGWVTEAALLGLAEAIDDISYTY